MEAAAADPEISAAPGGFRRPDGGVRGGPWLGDPACGMRGGLAHLLPDGLHMSGDAYRVFFEALVPFVGAEWKGIAPEDRRGYVFPDWSVINPPNGP